MPRDVVTGPLVRSRPLELSRLARLAVEGRGLQWFAARPRTPDDWRAAVGAVQRAFAARDWLSPLLPAFAGTGAGVERLRRAARSGGVVVTTGQQPGLFGGPIYTWSKALAALALADLIEREAGVPAAPVFWAATYDADFAEASVTHVAVGPRVDRIAMPAPALTGQGMAVTPLGDIRTQLDALEGAAGALADPAALALVRAAYGPDATVGSAFVALLRGVLESLGIAVLDAGSDAVREASRPLLQRALDDAVLLDHVLTARDAELRAAGFHPQVPSVKGLTLVFARRHGTRERIPLADAALSHDALEPNVLLRPVLERGLLPTVAYLGGPGEMAYFAQSGAVADALGVPRPLVLPRWSGLLIEPHVQRILERHDLAPDDVRSAEAALGRLVREALPADLRRALDALHGTVDHAVDAVAAALDTTTPPLVAPEVIEGARHTMRHRASRLQRRIVAAAKRRSEDTARDVAVAHAALFPFGRLQERVLNLMPLLARHGPALLAAMLDGARTHAAALVSGAPAERSAVLHGHAGDAR